MRGCGVSLRSLHRDRDAAAAADQRVQAVAHRPAGRLQLAADFYCCSPPRAPFGRAELSFLRWEIARGVLDPETGSEWWRAVNARLLRDKVEADLLDDGV